MRNDKRERLEAKGWRVGEPSDFLALTPDENAYIELKLRLADGLRLERQRRYMTQGELAAMLRSSQSRVAKMEAGDPSVTLDLLVRSLLALGTNPRALARLIASPKAA